MVQVFEQAPRLALRPFVERFLVVAFPPHHRDVHLPDIGAVVAFSFRGGCRIDDGGWAPLSAITGLRERLRAHEHCDGHAVLLALLTPVAAPAFFAAPPDEIVGTTVDLAGLLGRRSVDRLGDQLAGAANHRQRILLVEELLLARLRLSEPDPLVAAAVTWLRRSKGAARIDDLTRAVGLSHSALERRFRRVVGVAPKRVASVLRLQHAVRLRAAGADFTTAAHAAGYFDQSHFIKEFQRATGRPPDAFFRERGVHLSSPHPPAKSSRDRSPNRSSSPAPRRSCDTPNSYKSPSRPRS